MRQITQDDLNAAARGLGMHRYSYYDLTVLMDQHKNDSNFAGKVIYAAAKQMRAAKSRVGLIRKNPLPAGVRIVHNRLLGGWYVVRGPHQTPLNGRFNSKAEAQAWLMRGNPAPRHGARNIHRRSQITKRAPSRRLIRRRRRNTAKGFFPNPRQAHAAQREVYNSQKNRPSPKQLAARRKFAAMARAGAFHKTKRARHNPAPVTVPASDYARYCILEEKSGKWVFVAGSDSKAVALDFAKQYARKHRVRVKVMDRN